MTPLTALWLPILLSAVIVFITSSILHMMVPWHRSDYSRVPDEDKFMGSVRAMSIPPGDYMVPRPMTREEFKSPEFAEKFQKGPAMVLTIFPAGPMSMGRNLLLWFLYCVVVGIFAAYLTCHALPPGAHYLRVFRFIGTTAFMGYALALWQFSIWYRRKWSTTIKSSIDGLIYALLTAGTFGWLWPK